MNPSMFEDAMFLSCTWNLHIEFLGVLVRFIFCIWKAETRERERIVHGLTTQLATIAWARPGWSWNSIGVAHVRGRGSYTDSARVEAGQLGLQHAPVTQDLCGRQQCNSFDNSVKLTILGSKSRASVLPTIWPQCVVFTVTFHTFYLLVLEFCSFF